jgi:hypothetical protein
MSMLLMIPAIAMLLFDPAKTTCKAMPDARTRLSKCS